MLAASACAAHKVTYIANEGFLIDTGSRKILIDAIFDDQTIDYCHVPDPGTLASLESAAPPFDGVDVILVTHRHHDHFAVQPVLRHLSSNPAAVLVAPSQVVELLRGRGTALEGLGERIREVTLDLHRSGDLLVHGIRIEAHRLRHAAYLVKAGESGGSHDVHEWVENIAYLVDVDGLRLFHAGDALLSQNLEYFTAERFSRQKVDLAFLGFFDRSEETRRLLQVWLSPDHVVFMHLPREKDESEGLTAELTETFPNAVVFREPLQTRSF